MFRKIFNVLIIIFVTFLTLTSCAKKIDVDRSVKADDTYHLSFDNGEVFLDGNKVKEYDYIWHIDSNGDYSEVKDSPSEYYEGIVPEDPIGVWVAHDIKYFPMIDKNKFYKTEVNANMEWATNYENEKYNDLLFASLPRKDDEFPSHMMHTKEEAYENPCLHITEPGTYELSGKWRGQIFIDLGKNSKVDINKKINLVLNNVEIDCTVAPAIYIYRAYECDNKWEDRKDLKKDIDISDAGANLIIKDNTKNYIKGANVYRIYETAIKKSGKSQKTAIKEDGAIQSSVSLNINGETKGNGELYIDASMEGISSDLHFAFNGGKVLINANDDGINCSETNVSVLKISGGYIRINAGLGYEGDGIDSNGYAILDGGDVVSVANYEMDPGIDATNGLYINGGKIVALGESYSEDWAKAYINDNIDQSFVFKSFENIKDKETKLSVIDENNEIVYSFCENDDEFIKNHARPFIGVFISNEKIKKGVKYDVVSDNKKNESIKEEIKDIEEKDHELNDKLNNAMTQLDMNMISQEIYELWDNELNSLWNRIKEKDKLLEEQREWIKEKEKKVKEAGAEYEGGSMKPLVESMEAAKITKERVYILVKYFENLQ